jgi:sulfatase modifying factor 1
MLRYACLMWRRPSIVGSALLTLLACGGDDEGGAGGAAVGGMTGQGGSPVAGGDPAGGGGSGGTTTTPGCAATCGPAQSDDCCARAAVPGGTFFRGYDGVTHMDMTHPATVSAFELDVYAVTVGRFRVFVEAGFGTQASAPASDAGAHPLVADSGWFSGWDTFLSSDSAALKTALLCKADTQTWSDAPDPSREALPINCVTWFEAFAFCVWDDARLATEAEWNFASAGGDEQREYPWGSGLDESHAAYNCLADGMAGCTFADILAVGSLSPTGDGKWGHADLSGNVWEFVYDWWEPYIDPCVDCANTTVSMYHTARGGSWGSTAPGVTASFRDFVVPASRSGEFGFRCASTP